MKILLVVAGTFVALIVLVVVAAKKTPVKCYRLEKSAHAIDVDSGGWREPKRPSKHP